MKQDIKDGKNISLDDITVINEGISLAEKVEEKKEEQQADSVAPSVDEVAPEVEAPEITPDVVVGDNVTDNSISTPVVETELQNDLTAPSPIDFTSQPSVEVPDVSDNPIFPSIPSAGSASSTEFDATTFDPTAFDFNSLANSISENENVFSSFSNDNSLTSSDYNQVSDDNTSGFNSFQNNDNYDNAFNYNSIQSNEELPVEHRNIISLAESSGREYLKIYRELDQERKEKEQLKGYIKDLENKIINYENKIANYSVQVEAMRTRVLDMFGMGGMTGGMQKNAVNSYPNFNDSQPNNNGMNIAA